eukprot:31405-Pelagococcus_subviridis.AAC.13
MRNARIHGPISACRRRCSASAVAAASADSQWPRCAYAVAPRHRARSHSRAFDRAWSSFSMSATAAAAAPRATTQSPWQHSA